VGAPVREVARRAQQALPEVPRQMERGPQASGHARSLQGSVGVSSGRAASLSRPQSRPSPMVKRNIPPDRHQRFRGFFWFGACDHEWGKHLRVAPAGPTADPGLTKVRRRRHRPGTPHHDGYQVYKLLQRRPACVFQLAVLAVEPISKIPRPQQLGLIRPQTAHSPRFFGAEKNKR